MEITCPRCHSLHEIEPPASARARGPRSLKFRCSHCGHTFTVDPIVAEEPAPNPLVSPAGETIALVQIDGRVFTVPDLAAVQRLIIEGKLTRDASLSNHGLRWVRAGDREDLAIFFSAADAVAFRDRNLRTEMPREVDEEIVVDMEEAEEDWPPGSPVAIGPGLDPLGRSDLDTMIVDFGMSRDDTIEQTVAGNIDETPIPEVPHGFGRAAPEPTVPLRSAPVIIPEADVLWWTGPEPVSAIPIPAAVSTVAPRPAPWGSVATGSSRSGPPSDGAAGQSAASLSGTNGPTDAPGGPPPTTLVPPAGPSISQAFFFDASPVRPTPSGPAPARGAAESEPRDVFDEPSGITSAPRPAWFPMAGLGLGLAALLLVGWALWPTGGAESLAKDLTGAARHVEPGEGPPAGPPEAPKVEAPKVEAPKVEAPKVEAPKVEAPKVEAPKVEAPKVEAPKVEAPKVEAPKVEAPKVEAPKVEAPKVEAPKVEAPKPRAVAASPAAAVPKPTSSGGSAKNLVSNGWKAVEAEDYGKAHGLFDRALSSGPTSSAYYGRAYANEKLGDAVSATEDYCRALTTGSVDVGTSREIEAGLRRVGRSCP